MNVKTLLSAIGGLMGIGAVVMFVQTNLFTSPITTSIAIIAVGFAVLAAMKQTGDRELELTGVIICSVSLIAGVLYSVLQLTTGSLTITITLGFFSVMFLLAAYLTQTDQEFVTDRNTKIAAIIFIILAIGIGGVDAFMGPPTYDIELNDTVTREPMEEQTPYGLEGHQYALGTVTVTNPSFLPQEADKPNYRACLTGVNFESKDQDERFDERFQNDLSIYTTDMNRYITGTQTATLSLPSGLVPDIESRTNTKVTDYTVQMKASCPDSTEEPTITVRNPYALSK